MNPPSLTPVLIELMSITQVSDPFFSNTIGNRVGAASTSRWFFTDHDVAHNAPVGFAMDYLEGYRFTPMPVAKNRGSTSNA